MAVPAEQFAELFARLREEWDQSEACIKAAEQVNGDVVMPSIMELRYAGRRAVDALNAAATGKMEDAKDYLSDAIFNCHCSRHDAIDVATAVIAQQLEDVAKKLGYEHVLAAYPAYAELHTRTSRIKAKIRLSRGDRSKRAEIYEAIHTDDLPSLASAYEEFLGARSLMSKLAARGRRRLLLGWIGAGLTFLLGAAALARDFFNWTWPLG